MSTLSEPDNGQAEAARLDAPLLVCPETADPFEQFRRQTREAALDLVGRPPFDEPPPLAAEVVEETDCGTYVRKKVRYGQPSNDVVWAWLLVPRGLSGPAAAILCLAGSYMTPNWGKDAVVGLAGPSVEGDPECYGADLAEHGYVTLCPDYPCAGERVHAGLKPYDTSDLDRRFPAWSRVGMSLWDVGRAVDFLLTCPEVDPERIGCTGLSQGGDMTVWGAAMDERIAAAVPVCGWSPWRGRPSENLTAPYNYPGMRPYVERGQPLPFSMEHLAAMIAPGSFLNISGSQDPGFPNKAELASAERKLAQLYDQLGHGDRFQALCLDHGHRYSPEAARESVKWFDRWLCTGDPS